VTFVFCSREAVKNLKYSRKNLLKISLPYKCLCEGVSPKQSPVLQDVSTQKEIATPPKSRAAARNDINLRDVR
jgi:hypothetical protein